MSLSRSNPGVQENIPHVVADITNIKSLQNGIQTGFDDVIFCVSPDKMDEETYRLVYICGFQNIISILKAHPPQRYLVFSSTSVYSQNHGEWITEVSPTEPENFRGQVMLELEQTAFKTDSQVIILRLSGIYGKSNSRLFNRAIQNDIPASQLYRYTNRIHSTDASGFAVHLLKQQIPRQHEIYIASDNLPVLQIEVLNAIRLAAGLPAFKAEKTRETGKRCCNAKMLATGYALQVPTYKEGLLY